MEDGSAEAIISTIKAIPSTLQGDISESQAALIMYLTRDAMIDCEWDDNPIVDVIWADCRVTELSKANASRFIDYFGDKSDSGWKVKRLAQMTVLWHEFIKKQGQLELW